MRNLCAVSAALLVLFLSACQKEITYEPVSQQNISTTQSADSAVNLLCNFLPLKESWNSFSSLNNWYRQACANYSLQLSDSVSRDGNYSLRSEIFYTDPLVKSGHRAEILRRPETGKERWYGFSIFAPTSYVPDPDREIVAQWHTTPDLGDHPGPCVALKTDNGKWLVTIAWDPNRITKQHPHKAFTLNNVNLNKWTDWVFHIKFSYKSDGIVQVWQNGKLLVDYKGPCWFNDAVLPYQKLGVYKGSWKNVTSPATTHRVLFYDKIAVADETGGYANVAP